MKLIGVLLRRLVIFPEPFTMDAYLGIKYKLESTSGDWDDFMKTAGADFATRTLGNMLSPVLQLVKEADGRFTLHTTTPVKKYVITFALGEEFDDETPAGKKARSTVTMQGSTMTQLVKGGDHADVTVIREFGPDQLKATFKINNIVASRIYKKTD